MPYDPNDDDIIINGTLKRWLKYRVKFGSYALPGYVVALLLAGAGFLAGKLA